MEKTEKNTTEMTEITKININVYGKREWKQKKRQILYTNKLKNKTQTKSGKKTKNEDENVIYRWNTIDKDKIKHENRFENEKVSDVTMKQTVSFYIIDVIYVRK